MRSTDELLSSIVDETDGGIFWVADTLTAAIGVGDGASVPDIRRVRAGRDTAGRNWIGLKANNQYTVQSVSQMTLLVAPLALILILGSLLIGWYREGK